MTRFFRRALATVLLLLVLAHTTQAETHQTVPSANFSFIPDLQNFLRLEDANREADLHSNTIVSGGIHTTSAGLTGSPSALLAYISGMYIIESGSITYPDASVCHVIAHTETTSNYGSYTRVSGTHYLLNCGATLPPIIPANSTLLMSVTTSGGAITAVSDLRALGPVSGFDACRYTSLAAALTAYGAGPGTFTVSCPLPADQNAVLPANTTLKFERAGYFFCNTNGVTLTLNGPIDASIRTIFALSNGCVVTPSVSGVSILYPQWWGVKGDGTTNNATNLQLAVTALPAGSMLYFPCGDYRTLSAITISSADRQRITGAGACASIQNDTSNTGVFFVTAGADFLEIDHLKLISTGTLSTLGRGLIYLNPAGTATAIRSASFHHLWLAGGSTSGISGNCLTDSIIADNFIYNDGSAYGEHGIYLSNAGCVSTRNTITANYLWSTAAGNSAGIAMRQLEYSTISANTIIGWKYNLLPLTDAAGPTRNVRMSNNLLIGASTDGVNFFADGGSTALTELALVSNLITGAGRNGLRIEIAAVSCTVSENDIVHNGATGVYLYTTTKSHFSGNRIQDNDSDSNGSGGFDSAGLYLAENNTGNTFTHNTINVSDTGSYQKYGISIGSSGNTGNYFLTNILASNRTAERDVGATTNYWLHIDTAGAWYVGRVDNALIGLPADEGTCSFSAATSKVCSLTYTQADTNYRVLMTCNANKTFWVNTKTTTSFTANASSSSSDNCDWVLLRYQ